MIRVLSALTASALLAGCIAPAKPTPRTAPFVEAEYHRYTLAGTGILKGQAFLTQRGGGVVKGAGRTVYLEPATSIGNETFNALRFGRNIEPLDGQPRDFVRSTNADADGNFEFTGVPEGSYFVYCNITWEVPSGRYSMSREGGWMGEQIYITNGRTATVQLSRTLR